MSTIEVAVAGRGIQVKQGYEKPSAGDVNTCAVSLAIESGGVWDDLPHKRVTFATRTASVTVDYSPTISIPHEVMASPGALYLTLTGYDADGIEVARTHRMTYPIEVAKAGADEGAEPTPATLDVVSRIDALASTLEASETTRQEAFESAQNERSSAFEASMSEWQQDVSESVSQVSTAIETANNAATSANNAASAATEATENANEAADNANNAANELRETAERGDFDGAPGEPGADGYSPTASVTKNGGTATITVTDKNGTTTATVSDGTPGSDATATDVRINGTSITKNGVADIPIARNGKPGVVGMYGFFGLAVGTSTNAYVVETSINEINARSSPYKPITPHTMDYAVKAAMCDGKGAAWTADEQKAARERMNAADANNVYIMQKQIENLQGIAATEETDSTEAYTKTVPTGAQKWASLDKVGGKTVVWNQGELMSAEVVEVESKGKNLLDPSLLIFNRGVSSDNGIVYTTSSNNLYATEEYIDVRWLAGSNITFSGLLATKDTTAAFYDINKTFISSTHFNHVNMTRTVPSNAAYMRYDCHRLNVDGGMLQIERGTVATPYSPYGVKGTFIIPDEVRDMCPGYGWSAGTVCNEIDFERKVYVQRVGSVDLGTLTFVKFGQTDEYAGIFSSTVPGIYVPGSNDYAARLDGLVSSRYQVDTNAAVNSSMTNMSMKRLAGAVVIKDMSLSDKPGIYPGEDLSGVLLYYELAEPIEVDLSDVLPDDHYIEVEAGGTITFKQASTQLPVPSSVTYQISTSEVIANA